MMLGLAGNGLGVVVVVVVVVVVLVVVVVVVVLLLLVEVVVVELVELLLLLLLLLAAGTVVELLLLAPPCAAFGSVALLLILVPPLLVPMTSLVVPPSASFLSALGVACCSCVPAVGALTADGVATVAELDAIDVADCTVGVSVFLILRERWAAPLSALLLLLSLLGFSGLCTGLGFSDLSVSFALSLATSVNLVIGCVEFTFFSTVLAPAGVVAGVAALLPVPLMEVVDEFFVSAAIPVGISTARTVHTASCASSKSNGSTFISRDANVKRQR